MTITIGPIVLPILLTIGIWLWGVFGGRTDGYDTYGIGAAVDSLVRAAVSTILTLSVWLVFCVVKLFGWS